MKLGKAEVFEEDDTLDEETLREFLMDLVDDDDELKGP